VIVTEKPLNLTNASLNRLVVAAFKVAVASKFAVVVGVMATNGGAKLKFEEKPGCPDETALIDAIDGVALTFIATVASMLAVPGGLKGIVSP
jgi:hypothetical protein